MKREQKETTVAELTGLLEQALAVFVTDFKGLRVDEMMNLRRKIGEAGGQYRVAKNTLITRAARGARVESLTQFLAGNNAMSTTSKDPAALAKALVEFAKTNEKLVIKGGVLEGRPLTFDQIKAIAALPSREVLLARMLGALNAVPAGLVRVLAALPRNLLYALSAVRDQKAEQAG
ncbi:MAG: 50S ribosomal protein L10 [Thermodesulfobacteriota bacterium]